MNESPFAPAASVLLLVHGDVDAVARWLRKGITPAVVAGLADGWVAVSPASAVSLAAPPYEDSASTMLARPVPRRLRPAIGMRVVGPRLLIAVVPDAVLAKPAWLAWEPARALIKPGGLPSASVAQLAQAAGASERHTVDEVRRVLRAPQGRALDVAADLFDVLRLPGLPVLRGEQRLADAPDARRVDPERRHVAAFERAVGDGRPAADGDVVALREQRGERGERL